MDVKNKTINESSVNNDDGEKPCRACMDFRSWMKLQKTKSGMEQEKLKGDTSRLLSSGAFQKFNIPSEEDYGGRGRLRKPLEKHPIETVASVDPDNEEIPLWGAAATYGCPADSLSLGRGSWRLLHTTAAYYPLNPSTDVQNDMRSFITLFSKFYPCKPCADDFREWIKENPPEVGSKLLLSKWLCYAHNEVNRKLDKPEFDCSLVDQRWSEGWKDGSCD